MDIDGLYSGMAKAPLKGKGNYMGEGAFTTKIKATKLIKGVDAKTGADRRTFIVEFDVVTSDSEFHKPGSLGSQAIVLDKPQAFGDAKAFVFAAALNLDPAAVAEPEDDPAPHEAATEIFKATISKDYSTKVEIPQDTMIGKVLKLQTKKYKTKAGGDFTKYSWSPLDKEASA